MTNAKEEWQHIKTITDGEEFKINGLNIWDSEWKDTGERIQVKDPLYRQDFTCSVYEIIRGGTSAKFAATEFSNCVWGIFLRK